MAKIIDHKLIYYHFPKTGGQWMSPMLRQCGLTFGDRYIEVNDCHWTQKMLRSFGEYRQYFELFDTLPGILVKRDPLDWYVSYWRYQSQKNWQGFDASWWGSQIKELKGLGFNEFVEKATFYFKRKYGMTFYGYLWHNFTMDFRGYILSYESYTDRIFDLMEAYGIKFDKSIYLRLKNEKENPSTFEYPEISTATRQTILELDYKKET